MRIFRLLGWLGPHTERSPPSVTRGPEVGPACAPPGALGGAMGSGEERLRPPFNLAAGAGLAGPPGPCGLPGSVPALPAARTAAQPGHSPRQADSSTLACCPHPHPNRPFSRAPLSPHSTISDFLQPSTTPTPATLRSPSSRPRSTLSGHGPASSTAPSRGLAGHSPCFRNPRSAQPLLCTAPALRSPCSPQLLLSAAPSSSAVQDAGPGSLCNREGVCARSHPHTRPTHIMNAYTTHPHTQQQTHI